MADTQYTIDKFWLPLLKASGRGLDGQVQGWRHVKDKLEAFCEAPFTLPKARNSLTEANPSVTKVFLISSPGAVGKTTFACELAARTGAMLVDLAKTLPVGANTLSGGLTKVNLMDKFNQGDVSLIVDGLDEGRMRAQSGDNFSAFIQDVVDLVQHSRRCKPIVLLGRSIAVEETWLTLNVEGINPAVFQIDYYGEKDAIKFVEHQVAVKTRAANNANILAPVTQPQAHAIKLYLEKIRCLVGAVGANQFTQSFAGYSPVLMAVAESVFRAANSQHLINHLDQESALVSIKNIADSILEREQKKIETISIESGEYTKRNLYTPAEQLSRLTEKYAYQHTHATIPPFRHEVVSDLTHEDQEKYESAISGFLPDHPFLDQKEQRPQPSELFGGYIAVDALRRPEYPPEVKKAVRDEEINRSKINPFIAHFYMEVLDADATTNAPASIPSDHIGLIYASLYAGIPLEHTADLKILEDSANRHIVEIAKNDEEPGNITNYVAEGAEFVFGSQLVMVEIRSSTAEVTIGTGSEVVFVPPVSIDTRGLAISASSVVIDPPRTGHESRNAVFLNAKTFVADLRKAPTVRQNTKLQIAVEDTPWPLRSYSVEPDRPEPDMHEPLIRLKRILGRMRSSTYGGYRAACSVIDSTRFTQGSGLDVLDILLEKKVLTKDGAFFQLDMDQLTNQVGLNLDQVHGVGYTEKTIAFLTPVKKSTR